MRGRWKAWAERSAELRGPWMALITLALVLLHAALARADALGDLEKPFSAALQSGSWVYALGLIFLAGVATSLTPCVYPMIAITVSIFGARSSTSRSEAAL